MTNYCHYKNTIIMKSFKLILLLFLLFSASFIILSALGRQPSCFSAPEWRFHPNIPQTRELSPGVSEPPMDISHVLFGISGSVHTWTDRRHYSELWWQPNITRGFVWLDKEPEPKAKLFSHPNSLPFKVSENVTRLNLNNVGPNPAVRIARIVLESFNLGLPNVRWFVMGDDDTVFFADNLVSVLSKYDHRNMYYIGGNSESVGQDVKHSYGTAFGGGGFAVSYALAAELVRVLDACLDRYRWFYGSDERVRGCVTELGVSLTVERGFHQMDIRGDAYGLLAAHPMTPLVSLHHLDYINPLLPNRTKYESLNTLIQTYRHDPLRVVQQSFCYYKTWSISVSWGYTVQIYPTLLTAVELVMPMQTFLTWDTYKDGPFTFNTRLFPTNPCELPAMYYISQVQEAGNDTVTTYTRDMTVNICKNKDYPSKIEKVVVLASKMDPYYGIEVFILRDHNSKWHVVQGTKRQCCEIRKWKYKSVQIRIRNCKYGETITTST